MLAISRVFSTDAAVDVTVSREPEMALDSERKMDMMCLLMSDEMSLVEDAVLARLEVERVRSKGGPV